MKTEANLVLGYLIKAYSITVSSNMIRGVTFIDGELLTFSEFVEEIDQIFGFDTHEICVRWYEKTYDDACEDIHKFLNQLSFVNGRSNWELYTSDGRLFGITFLYNKFEGEYEQELLLHIFTKWYEDAIIDHCEGIM